MPGSVLSTEKSSVSSTSGVLNQNIWEREEKKKNLNYTCKLFPVVIIIWLQKGDEKVI